MAKAASIASARLSTGRSSTHGPCTGVTTFNDVAVDMLRQRFCRSSAPMKPAASKARDQAGRSGRLWGHPVRLGRVAMHVAREQPATPRWRQWTRREAPVHTDKALLPARWEGTFATGMHRVHVPEVQRRRWRRGKRWQHRRSSSTPGETSPIVGTAICGSTTLFIRLRQVNKCSSCGTVTRKSTTAARSCVQHRRVLWRSSRQWGPPRRMTRQITSATVARTRSGGVSAATAKCLTRGWPTVVPGKLHTDELHTATIIIIITDEAIQLEIRRRRPEAIRP